MLVILSFCAVELAPIVILTSLDCDLWEDGSIAFALCRGGVCVHVFTLFSVASCHLTSAEQLTDVDCVLKVKMVSSLSISL